MLFPSLTDDWHYSWWFPNKKASSGDGNWWDQSPLITIDYHHHYHWLIQKMRPTILIVSVSHHVVSIQPLVRTSPVSASWSCGKFFEDWTVFCKVVLSWSFWKDFFMDTTVPKHIPNYLMIASISKKDVCNYAYANMHIYIEYTHNCSHFFSYLWCLFLAARWFGNGISWHFQVWPKCHVACRTKGCASAKIPIGKHLMWKNHWSATKKVAAFFWDSLPPIIMEVTANGCISSRIVTFQISRHFHWTMIMGV